MSSRAHRFAGVYSVLATPFEDHGAIDLEGLGRVVDFQLESGVAGVVCFGLASEGYKLSDDERRTILSVVVERAGGSVEVVAGTEHNGVDAAIARSVEAEKAGASALMLMPPSFVRPTASGLVDYYARVAEAVSVPVIVQDAPAWTGVEVAVTTLVELARRAPTAAYVKVEASPTADKIAALESNGVECIGGLAALYLLEELERGVTATMPGCAYPAAYVELLRLHGEGHREQARELAFRLLPLSVWSIASLDRFVAFQKHLLARGGLIESDRLREPASVPDQASLAWFDELVRSAAIDRYLPY